MKQHNSNPSGDVYRTVLHTGKGGGYNKAVLRLGIGYINIRYKISSVFWDNRLTWFLTWSWCMGKRETFSFEAPNNSSHYLPKLCDVVLFITFGKRHMTYKDQVKCCTISHNQSQPVRRRTNKSTISHNRRSVKQRRTELSYTVCEIAIRDQEKKKNSTRIIRCPCHYL